MPRVSKWTIGATTTLVAALAMLTMSLATAADGAVSVTVTPIQLSIDVDPGDVAFSNRAVNSTFSLINAKTVTNNGLVTWASLTADYTGAVDQQANCGGPPYWAAHDTTPNDNIFVMSIDDNAEDAGSDGEFDEAGIVIPADSDPSVAFNDSTVATAGTLELDFELVMPTSVSTGTAQCTIGITLTASS